MGNVYSLDDKRKERNAALELEKRQKAKKAAKKKDRPIEHDDSGNLSPSQFAKMSEWED